jgi:hypothetical protein
MNKLTDSSGRMPTLDEWKTHVESKLIDIIKVWESKMGEDDKSMYTLGVRRALDVVLGEDPEL